MKRIFVLLGILVSMGLMGCATVRVAVNYDEAVDFGEYQSFYFVKPRPQQQRGTPGRSVRNPLFTKDVMNEIRPLMEGKGYVEATSQREADLLVVFFASTQHRRDWVAPTYHVGRWGRVWRTSPGHVVHYKEGTLIIDMVDNRKKELVWQGVGTGVLDRTNPGANLVDAVQEILAQFPPEFEY